MRRLTWTALGACLLLAGGVVLAQSPNPPTPVLDLVNAVVKATGATVARPVANQIKELTAQDFDAAAGGGTADDTVAMQALFNSGKPVFLTAGTYSVTCLTVPSGLTLRGAGTSAAKIVQRAGSTCATLTGTGAADVSISGVSIDAAGTGAYAILSQTAGARWRVFNNVLKGATSDCLRFQSGTDTVASGNTISGCGTHGITWASQASRFSATDNHITSVGGAGIIFSIGTDGSVKGNTVSDSGPSGDCITGYNVANLRIAISSNTCLNHSNNGIHVAGTQLTITGNNVYSPALTGIFVRGTTTGSSVDPIAVSNQVTVSGNNVYNTTTANQIGIFVGAVNNGSVTGNVVMNATQAGILVGLSNFVTVTGNTVGNTTGNGIMLRGTQKSLIAGNLVNSVTLDGFRLEQDTSNGLGGGTVLSSSNTVSSNSSIGNNRDYVDAGGSGSNYYAFNNSAASVAGASPQIVMGALSPWIGTANASSDLQLGTPGGRQMLIKDTALTVNYFQISGSAAGVSPSITVNGSDTNRPFNLTGKGSGVVGISPGDFYASAKMTTNAGVVMLNMPASCSGQPTKTLANIAGVVNICP